MDNFTCTCNTSPCIEKAVLEVAGNKEVKDKFYQILFKNEVPFTGLASSDIEIFLQTLSNFDSNNIKNQGKVGEREARFASELVAKRHFKMGHGLGRSGDLLEFQPKAPGSSLLGRISNRLALDMLCTLGVPNTKACVIFPMATGMSLMFCLLYLKSKRPEGKYVIWSRVDQKSCFKCILTAGLTPIVIDCIFDHGLLSTDINSINDSIIELGKENIVCVMTTTSCFAPRGHDKLIEVAEMCKKYDIPHLVNNAYGIQSLKCMNLIQEASKVRVDFYVASLDKNFMLPVGGAIIAGFKIQHIQELAKMYPGRASSSQCIDFFITVLELGKFGYLELKFQREECFESLQNIMSTMFPNDTTALCLSPHNDISVALRLDTFSVEDATELGAMLFRRCISGSRVVSCIEQKVIKNHMFQCWGSHTSSRGKPYLVAAAAIGITEDDLFRFQTKLKAIIFDISKHHKLVAEIQIPNLIEANLLDNDDE